jgi:hypothetical protein
MTFAGFNRRMRKTACPVVWKGHGAKSPCPHPILSRAMPVTLHTSKFDQSIIWSAFSATLRDSSEGGPCRMAFLS